MLSRLGSVGVIVNYNTMTVTVYFGRLSQASDWVGFYPCQWVLHRKQYLSEKGFTCREMI